MLELKIQAASDGMGWLEFVASIISSLAWPVAAVIITLAFRRQITSLLNKIRRLTWGDKALDFAEKLDKVEQTLHAELENSDGPALTPPIPDNRFGRLLEISPSAAILDSWAPVEKLIREIGQKRGIDSKRVIVPIQVVRQLRDEGIINGSVYEMVRDLRSIRNAAAHQLDVTATDAYRFHKLAYQVTSELGALRSSL